MLFRDRQFKHFLVLVGAQMICVAAGLWIHHYLILSAVYQAAEREVSDELAGAMDEMANALAGANVHDEQTAAAALATLGRVLPQHAGDDVALASADWEVLGTLPAAGQHAGFALDPGQRLPWSATPEASGESVRMSGTLRLDDVLHAAVARRLPAGDVYLVAHREFGGSTAALAALATPLLVAGAITMAWTCALLGIATYMIAAKLFDEISARRSQSEGETLRRIQSLSRTRDAVIFGLARLAESRDGATGAHLDRICAYASRLAGALRDNPRYADIVTAEFVQNIGISAALHDVGKVGIQDAILLKPGLLTAAERLRMQQHTIIGADCLAEMERRLGTSNFLEMAREITLAHHERWDGLGYPHGLAGEAIPLSARIVTIADVYDAFASQRVYKAAMPHHECVDRIRQDSGKQFDPSLVDVFLKIEHSFQEISRRYGTDVSDANQGARLPCKTT
jgi:HD-GYP domain-containing protein (c-di-GMP phosphodiesterase class II)